MQIQPYLFFDGNCEEALKFYEKALNGKIGAVMRVRGSPAEKQMPKEMSDKILNARLDIGNMTILASDCPPGTFNKPQGFAVVLAVDKAAEGERIFKALEQGGAVKMPYEQTFWAHRFGMVTDKFGTPWMINCEKEA